MDRDFLFGVLAVQTGLASPQQIMAAASGYVADKSRSIPQRLLSDRVFDKQALEMLDKMVEQAVAVHGGSVHKTLQTLGGERVLFSSFGGSLVQDDEGGLSISPKSESIEDTAAVTPEAPGRYRSEGVEIGRGGIGRVLVAFDEHVGRQVAVKELLSDGVGSRPTTPGTDAVTRTSALAARFLREARVTGQLEHPNIMPVYEVGQRPGGAYYYTMKLVRGRTLADALAACRSLGDRLKLLHHYVDLCNAVAYAHDRGVIHRDLKTENTMLGEFGETVLIDWGLAKVKGKRDFRGAEIEREVQVLHDEGTGKTMDGSAIGTPAYMSPEQADGAIDDIDERSDVWSLGAVLYELLTGKPPFEGVTPFEVIGKVLKDEVVPPRALNDAIPAELSAVAEKALTRDKKGRYQSASDLAAEIQAYMSGGRIKAYDYSAWELLKGFVAAHKAISGLVLTIVALVATGSVVLYRAYDSAEAQRRVAQQSKELAEKNEKQAQDNELVATLNLAIALQEKADRLFDERRVLASRIFAAAALTHHPCSRLGISTAADCEARYPGGASLRTRAISIVHQASLGVLASPEWTQRETTPLELVDVSADGKTLMTLARDTRVELWDLPTRKRLLSAPGPEAARTYRTGRALAALSPAGDRIGVSEEGAVALWDRSGKRLAKLSQEGEQHFLAFSADGATLAAAGDDGVVVLWDVAARERVATIDTQQTGVVRSALSPDGTLLASTTPASVRLWELAGGTLRSTIEGVAGVVSLGFSPDGRSLAAGTVGRTVELIDVQHGTLLHTLGGHDEGVNAVSFSPDGGLLASASNDKTVRLWDPATFELRYVIEGHRAAVRDLSFLGDGTSLASIGEDDTLRLWGMKRAPRAAMLTGHTMTIWDLDISPDGSTLVSASKDGSLRLWSVDGAKAPRILTQQVGAFTTVAFSPDGARVVTAGAMGDNGRSMIVWDVASGNPLRTIEAEPSLFSVAISPDGRTLASRAMAGTTQLWDADSGRMIRQIETDGAGQGRTVFSPDGTLVATGGADKSIRLWQVATGKRLKTLTGHPDVPYNFAFSADGKQLLSAGKRGHILLWDVASGSKSRELVGHQAWVNAVHFVPERPLAVSASDEGAVRIWSLETGRTLIILKTSKEAYDVVVTPDGKTLAVTDGVDVNDIHLYPIDLSLLAADPKQLLATAEAEAGMRLDGFTLMEAEGGN